MIGAKQERTVRPAAPAKAYADVAVGGPPAKRPTGSLTAGTGVVMNRRTVGAVAVAVGVFAAAAAGQEAVTIKEHAPKVGERVRVTEDVMNTIVTSFEAGGQKQGKTDKKGRSMVYVQEVLAMPATGRQPTKLKRTYEKAVDITDANTARRDVDGKTVLIEKKGEKYAFTVEGGGAVTGEAAKELEKEFGKKEDDDARRDMIPDRPLKPGETWVVKKERIAKELEGQPLQVDMDAVSGTGKLVKAYQKDGRQFGVIELTMVLPVTGLGPNNPVTVKKGSKLTMTLTGDGCVDGSIPVGTSVMKTTFALEGSVMGTDLKVTSAGTETKKTELLTGK